jgi:hypothetical protein
MKNKLKCDKITTIIYTFQQKRYNFETYIDNHVLLPQ